MPTPLPRWTRYTFGPFELDAHDRLLTAHGDVVPLTPKALETLLALLQHAGRVVTTEELLEQVWPDSFVEPNNLAQNVSALRKALSERDHGRRYIETVSKRGYRFVAPFSEEEPSTEAAEPDLLRGPLAGLASDIATRTVQPAGRLSVPATRYAHSGDVSIAYQVVGDGPFDLVFVMGWVSHLDYFWMEPTFARFLHRLASFSRVILFDKRGTGLSDRVTALPTLEQRMDDVRAVMEAARSERAALLGVSEGGPMCSLFAATYPEKTLALVMIGTYARRLRAPDYPWGPSEDEHQAFYDEIQRDWGGPVGLEARAPSRLHDPRFRTWWATYLRMGASPGAALALTRMNADIDVREVLPSVRVPTLILHRSGDRCLRVEEGRYVASRIPGARFRELPGDDHLPFVGDQEALLDEIERFLAEFETPESDRDRVLATALCGVTEGTATPRGQARLLALAAREVERFRGQLVRPYTGARPALLATFDGPARAIRCGSILAQAAERLACPIRLGVHTGECAIRGETISGLTADTAARVAAQAAIGEVIVSRTVRDLVAGSGLRFRACGQYIRHGEDGELALFCLES